MIGASGDLEYARYVGGAMRLATAFLALGLWAGDASCPRYPEAARAADVVRLAGQREFAAMPKGRPAAIGLPRANFVDEQLFAAMERDGVPAAALSSDAEFLRRVSLDLTGRIPQPAEVDAFLRDGRSDKRARMIESLLGSEGYTDRWTLYFGNRLRVTRNSRVTLAGRNLFHAWLRDAVRRDRPYKEWVSELLTSSGSAAQNGPVNFFARHITGIEFYPRQDLWDNLTDFVTTQFLGFKTECISCHNGRGHLERINLFLTPRTRLQFWETSAFWSRLSYVATGSGDSFVDGETGAYTGVTPPDEPGMRPLRHNALVTSPRFLLNGEEPAGPDWRAEFARIVTSNRQFARAAVNYIWAELFGSGIVDPPGGWDLARVDPATPPPAGWAMQNTHPELLERLADHFIQNQYSVRSVIRLIVNSNAWQMSSRPPQGWKPGMERYFAKHEPRRLYAEELFDAAAIATNTETPVYVSGFSEPFLYTGQLPDPAEPFNDFRVRDGLRELGRGDWLNQERDSRPSVLGLLYQMNAWDMVVRSFEWGPVLTRAQSLAGSNLNDEEAVRQLYLATLTRLPTAAESAVVLQSRKGRRVEWLSRLQWALLNKLDFIFNL